MSGNIMKELREGDVRKVFFEKNAKVFKCSYCALEVHSSSVERHLGNHTREVKGQFTCKYCCYTSDTRTVHETYHHRYLENPHKFMCEECRFAGDSQLSLDSHLSLNLHTEQQFGGQSGKEVRRKKSTPLTMDNSARSMKKFIFKVDLKKAYRCAFCGMAPDKLAVHIQGHQMKSDGDSTCKYCSFSWSGASSHQGNHTRFLQKEHKFRCDSCNFAGDTPSAMDAHLFLGLHGENGSRSSKACHQGKKTNITKCYTSMVGDNPGEHKKSLQRIRDVKLITTKKTETRDNGARKSGKYLKARKKKIGKYLKGRKKFLFKANNTNHCTFCGMTVESSAISTHLERHQKEKEGDLKCEYCSFSCSNVGGHQTMHKKFILKEHTFRCEHCNFAGDTQLAMNAHLLLGLHEECHGESSMVCQQREGIKQEGKINSSTRDPVKLSNTPAISGDAVQFRRIKDMCMARQIGGNRKCICLLCGMGMSSTSSLMKRHERRHHIMADADNLNKCDYCSYVSSMAFHNVSHKKFLRKHHKFVCDVQFRLRL